MGWPKYHEDDIKIQEFRGLFDSSVSFANHSKDHNIRVRCPYCGIQFPTRDKVCQHIKDFHADSYGVLSLNGKIITDKAVEIDTISSLTFHNYDDQPMHLSVRINDEKTILQCTVDKRSVQDIAPILKKQVIDVIEIGVAQGYKQRSYTIKCQLDINDMKLPELLKGSWKTKYFIEKIAAKEYTLTEIQKFLSIAAYEHDYDLMAYTLMDLEQCLSAQSIASENIIDFLLYYTLISGIQPKSLLENSISINELTAYSYLIELLSFSNHEVPILPPNKERNISQFRTGVFLLHAMLSQNNIEASFFKSRYDGKGILGDIVSAIDILVNAPVAELAQRLKEPCMSISLLKPKHFTLIDDIMCIYHAVIDQEDIPDRVYQQFCSLSPATCALKIQHTKDNGIRDKRIKSALKRFDTVEWFFSFASQYLDASWTSSRITMQTPELYWRYVERINSELRRPLTSELINHIKSAKAIHITPLGNAQYVGCSCFVVSTAGYNILLDAGVRPACGDSVPYPDFSRWGKNIDAIIISHAHMDHAGAITMAHSMWPDAPIITTHGTKNLLEPMLYDLAYDQDSIDETNLYFVEKHAACETYRSILAYDFNEWIWISHDLGIRLHPAGHILGAAIIELSVANSTIVYTGDFSLENLSVAGKAEIGCLPLSPDLLICEATNLNSNKTHILFEQRQHLENELSQAVHKNKTILLPSSAIGRSQELLCIIQKMKDRGQIPNDVPVYIAGFACQTCEAVQSVAGSDYVRILAQCKMLAEDELPVPNSIVIASSANLNRHAASYRIAEGIFNRNHKELCILSNGELREMPGILNGRVRYTACPLRSHADRNDICEIIKKLSPYSLTFVHWGERHKMERKKITEDLYNIFGGQILMINLQEQRTTNLKDLKDLLDKGKNNG